MKVPLYFMQIAVLLPVASTISVENGVNCQVLTFSINKQLSPLCALFLMPMCALTILCYVTYSAQIVENNSISCLCLWFNHVLKGDWVPKPRAQMRKCDDQVMDPGMLS